MATLATNKKALFNYELVDKFEAGLILDGWEVKSIRAGNISLKESYVIIKNNRAYLQGAHVGKWQGAVIPIGGETRDRELLLHKDELAKLFSAMKIKGQAIVPLNIHMAKHRIKAEIALARGKKLYDKRSVLKEKDQKSDIARDLKRMGM